MLLPTLIAISLCLAHGYVYPFGYTMNDHQQTMMPCSHDTACPTGHTCMPCGMGMNTNCCVSMTKLCPAGSMPKMMAMDKPTMCKGATDMTSCGMGSMCMKSMMHQDMHVCCETKMCPAMATMMTTTGTAHMCTGQTDTTSCPTGTMCMPSMQMNGQFVCCNMAMMNQQNMGHEGMCPMGATPVMEHGMPTVPKMCMGPHDMTTCPMGSTCMMSTTMPGMHVCCGARTMNMQATCPMGMKPMMQMNNMMPLTCMTQMDCPAGSMCMTTNGMRMCCGSMMTTAAHGMCPMGMMASMDPAMPSMPKMCMGPHDMTTCPMGATCMMSTTMPGMHVCCGTGMTMMHGMCPSGLMPATHPMMHNTPMMCHGPMDMTTCPMGSTCMMSMTMPGKFVCCGSMMMMMMMGSMNNMCPMGLTATTNPMTAMPITCMGSWDTMTCPMGSACMMSTTMPGMHVCCGGSMMKMPMNTMTAMCPMGMTTTMNPMMPGMPTSCMGTWDKMSCPMGSTCMPSMTMPGMHVCCGMGRMTGSCPSGMMPTMPTTCMGPWDTTSCPAGSMCTTCPSMPGHWSCCHPDMSMMMMMHQMPSWMMGHHPTSTTGHQSSCPFTDSMTRFWEMLRGNHGFTGSSMGHTGMHHDHTMMHDPIMHMKMMQMMGMMNKQPMMQHGMNTMMPRMWW